ncbi:DUF1304 domain-containing protein [Limosilactobacillus sp.]|uniref:DUF1304 domain-containing protein n=1 Tax=Limosilactobacillus sp. TaxID=2773925 RepID=UPI003DA887A3
MGIAFEIVTVLIGIEHLGIMLLEMFAQPGKQAKAFDMEESFLRQKAARVSMANQGIYNGMLGLLLIVSQFIFTGMTAIMVGRLLLLFVAVVGLYGALTATKKIWLFQFIPAVIGLILSL